MNPKELNLRKAVDSLDCPMLPKAFFKVRCTGLKKFEEAWHS